MTINKEIIERIAKNARLNLTEKEIKEFLPQLKEVIEVFSKLDEVKTDKIKPSVQPIDLINITRDDISENCLTQEQALSNTKNKKDNYFKGPKAV